MTQPVPQADESICWQCGAPAATHCAIEQPLVRARARHAGAGPWHMRAFGRSRYETMRLRIPRCESCRNRNWIAAFLMLMGGLFGALYGLSFPSSGWDFVIGAVLGALPFGLANAAYKRWRGLRFVAQYPRLLALRAAGWSEPN